MGTKYEISNYCILRKKCEFNIKLKDIIKDKSMLEFVGDNEVTTIGNMFCQKDCPFCEGLEPDPKGSLSKSILVCGNSK